METIPERPLPTSGSRPDRLRSVSDDLRSKEQRRRERRERRAARRTQQSYGAQPAPFTIYGSVYGSNMPDLLNSHLPPPAYSTLPHSGGGSRSSRSGGQPTPAGQPGQPPVGAAGPPPPTSMAVRSASSRLRFGRHQRLTNGTTDLQRSHASFFGEDSDPQKSCCGVIVTQTVSIRWFIVMIAFVGICCSIVGTVLGAMKASGREHLTVSLLMIGVGIVLITVSGIAWRLTASDAPSCRAMLGLGGYEEDYNNGRFLSRPQVTNNTTFGSATRPQHPYAAMMYSDFHYRPPPPSYQASMQEYRLRLLLLDRQSGGSHPAGPTSGPGLAIEPPPNYRAHLRNAMVHALTHSRPPSYKSHISDHPIIESGTNNDNTVITNTVTNSGSSGTTRNSLNGISGISGLRNNCANNGQNEVQVAQVHNVPRTPPDHSIHSVHSSVVDGISNQRLTSGGIDTTSGQDVSIVPVSNDKYDLDPDFHHHYHIKIGENQELSCDKCDEYVFDNTQTQKNKNKKADEEKRSVVTIVQTSTTSSNSNPVIVTVSGSAIGESGESGSEFSDIRASPAEVEILATL